MMLWEVGTLCRHGTLCVCTTRFYTSLDAQDNPYLLYVPDTNTRYEVAYFDAERNERAQKARAVILAAASTQTKHIRLTSAVSVLSSDDPVRVFQQFATLDLLSNGRAEIMAGRGSFIESFPLFGYDLAEYDALFQEKLELLLEIRDATRVHWAGRFRPPIDHLPIYPRPVQDPLPVWIAVGGNPPSVMRAARLGLPMALAIIGGPPERFVPMVDLYRATAAEAGHDPATLPISINSHGFVAEDSRKAADLAFPYFAEVMTRIGRERGWPPTTRASFEADRSLRGSLLVGDPEEVIDKMLREHELFRYDRFLIQLTVGTLPHADVLHAIEMLGTKVAPAVRKAVGVGTQSAEASSRP